MLSSATWFSGTAAAGALVREWSLSAAEAAWLTISVQAGFIVGTFLYALLNLADRFNARRVFLLSALAGALFNAGFAIFSSGPGSAALLRFLTGVTLAGVYPVGMKLVATWFETGLGWRLGIMVGALTLGTASPYLLVGMGRDLDWRWLAGSASLLAVLGGLLVLALSDGPFRRGTAPFEPRVAGKVFRNAPFRNTAFGYFGHMWELYAFWSLLVFFLADRWPDSGAAPALVAFATIAAGAAGCAAGGWASRRVGERRVASGSLVISFLLCVLSGWIYTLPAPLLVAALLVWGVFVVSDSPQFSALAARYCPPEYTGTALTVQNGIGFAITVVSLQLTPLLAETLGWQWAFVFLAPGPLLGYLAMRRVPEGE